MLDILILLGALVIILIGAELFTNGIEWFGRKLQLAEGAVGSVLAAVGTALPETMIPIIAIGFGGGGEATDAVGVGRDPGRAVHALARSRCSSPAWASSPIASGAPPATRCPSTPGSWRTTSATSSWATRSRSAPRSCRRWIHRS